MSAVRRLILTPQECLVGPRTSKKSLRMSRQHQSFPLNLLPQLLRLLSSALLLNKIMPPPLHPGKDRMSRFVDAYEKDREKNAGGQIFPTALQCGGSFYPKTLVFSLQQRSVPGFGNLLAFLELIASK